VRRARVQPAHPRIGRAEATGGHAAGPRAIQVRQFVMPSVAALCALPSPALAGDARVTGRTARFRRRPALLLRLHEEPTDARLCDILL